MGGAQEGGLRQARRLHSERCLGVLSLAIDTTLGLVIGFNRRLDATMMRVMDGLMAIPAILLALALMALMRGSVRNVIVALVVPQIPVIVRLVRASVLSLREAVMAEGARALVRKRIRWGSTTSTAECQVLGPECF